LRTTAHLLGDEQIVFGIDATATACLNRHTPCRATGSATDRWRSGERIVARLSHKPLTSPLDRV
jgi:hypothetical protein